MSRSHPPTLLTLTVRTVRELRLFSPGERVLVAVSGGPDSMALLDVLAKLRDKLGHELLAHGVDHGLRPEASRELDVAERLAAEHRVPFERTRVRVAPGGNLQARARIARYQALRAAAKAARASSIATAHHAEDRAETLLIRLLRGSGPTGLAVLPGRAGDLVRPFLRATRADIDAHVARHRVPFVVDPSNSERRFLRVRVRLELLPLLRQLSPGIVSHLCALADQLQSIREGMWADPGLVLPRPTRNALATLERSRSRKTRIRLPQGLVASYDHHHLAIVVDPDSQKAARKGGPHEKS